MFARDRIDVAVSTSMMRTLEVLLELPQFCCEADSRFRGLWARSGCCATLLATTSSLCSLLSWFLGEYVGEHLCSTLQCPPHSCRNPLESTGICRNGTGICRNPQEWDQYVAY